MTCYTFPPVSLLCLLACSLSVSLASVEPPTNVTLRCHNLQNILEWDYGILSPGIRFKVRIQPYSGKSQVVWVDPPELRADISFLRDSTNFYFVEVTAVVGQNESESAPPEGLTFSYAQGSLTTQTCSLDLPPVNITTQRDGHILLYFVHPWLWHHQTTDDNTNPKRQKKSNDAQNAKELPEFKYEVLVDTGHTRKKEPKGHCKKDVCHKEVPVDNVQEKHCVNITGEMQNMAVKATREYCSEPLGPPEQNGYVYIVIGSLVFTLVLLLIFFVYKKKTRASSPTPKAISITKMIHGPVGPTQDTCYVATVEPSSPTPLLPPDNEFTSTDITTDQPEFRVPLGLGRNVEEVVEEKPQNDNAYMEGNNMENDESVPSPRDTSGYEKRPVVVDLGEDELAEGYRIRNQ